MRAICGDGGVCKSFRTPPPHDRSQGTEVGELISEVEAARRARLCPDAEWYFVDLPGKSAHDSANVIDAYAMRNIAAFINFSCDPNLEMRKIASASGDKALPRVALFAIWALLGASLSVAALAAACVCAVLRRRHEGRVGVWLCRAQAEMHQVHQPRQRLRAVLLRQVHPRRPHQHYLMLTVFMEDERIPLDVLARHWDVSKFTRAVRPHPLCAARHGGQLLMHFEDSQSAPPHAKWKF